MKFHENKLLTAVAAAALTFAVAACSSNGDDDDTLAGTPDTGAPDTGAPDTGAPDTGAPAPLSELAAAQADAAAAATAAMTASGDAATAAEAAMDAVANLATMQTGATAGGLADEAQTAAGKAMMAYMDAKAASEAAAEAEEVTAAVEARIMAETAMGNAVKYGTMATDKATEAETAVMAELMIVVTVKTVGDTSLDATAGSTEVTTDGDTVVTGLIKSMNPEAQMVGMVGGVQYMLDNAQTTDEDEGVAHVQAVEARTFDIGKVVDSPDDMARLMIVTQYAGSKSVKVYATSTDPDVTGTLGSDGRITTSDGTVTLKSVGAYYLAGTDNDLAYDDVVLATAKGEDVFSFVNNRNTPEDATDDTDGHVILGSTTVAGAVTTVIYEQVDIMVAAATADEADAMSEVTAKIPDAADYEHIHFGVWAALGDPEKDGTQELSDLGIGFVQSIGDGLSGADMPNNGTADYSGNWAAAVQSADEDGDGDISLVYGAATIGADLSKATITTTLTDLATLTGAIDGNTFSGTKASGISAMHGLASDGTFTGSFSGGFYGKQAAEAGGIFDFTSEDAEDGAFRGAFGADRKFN